MKPYEGPWVLRSMLFVPSHIEKMVAKSAASDADCVVLDLEDAVPAENKVEAREVIRRSLAAGLFVRKTVFVRINPLDTGLTLRDLEAVACEQLHGFVYPMVYTPDDIKNFDAQLRLIENHLGLPSPHFSIVPLIETPLAVLHALAIANASRRVVALLFGCEDYLAELQGRYGERHATLDTPRALVAIAARAAGVEPVDTPFVQVHDLEGLVAFTARGRDLGMSGMLAMTPRQIGVIHEAYTPSPKELEDAGEIVRAADEARASGYGIVVINGKFVSPPTVKASRKLLERHAAIQALQAFAAG